MKDSPRDLPGEQPVRVTWIGQNIVIQLADGAGKPRLAEIAPGVWIERDAAGMVTTIELLLGPDGLAWSPAYE